MLSGEAAHESDPHMLTMDLPSCWLTTLAWAGDEGFLLYEQLFWPTGQVWAAPDALPVFLGACPGPAWCGSLLL